MSESTRVVQASWSYPSFGQLRNDTNCNVTTNYIADSVLMVTTGTYLTNREMGDIGYLVDWLDSLVPIGFEGLPARSKDWVMHDELLILWYYGVWQNETLKLPESEWTTMDAIQTQAVDFAYSCLDGATGQKMICDKLDIRGDPDVSGRGMMIAYYILIGLTTVYFLALIGGRTRSPKSRQTRAYHPMGIVDEYRHRAVNALQKTVSGFLVAALVFATAMLGATVARYYAYLRHRNEVDADDVSFYTWLGSAAMSSFSVFPCLVLQTVTDLSRSRYSRLFLWCLVISLAAVVWVLSVPSIDRFFELTQAYGRYETWYHSNTTEDFNDHDYNLLTNGTLYQAGIYRAMIWENHCDTGKLKDRLRILLTIGIYMQAPGFIYCLLASLIAIIFHSNLRPFVWFREHCDRISDLIRTINRIARPLIGLIYLVMAAVFLGSFIEYRNVAKKLAPSTDTDTNWSFGQILALAQWAPIGLDFLTEWRKEKAPAPKRDQWMVGGPGRDSQFSGSYGLVVGLEGDSRFSSTYKLGGSERDSQISSTYQPIGGSNAYPYGLGV